MGHCASIEKDQSPVQLMKDAYKVKSDKIEFKQFDEEPSQESCQMIVNKFKTHMTKNYFMKMNEDG